MSHKIEDSVFLLGGALLGAAAMYLMDPETGERRRQRLASAAESAYGSARHSAEGAWDHVTGHAKDVSQQSASKAAGWGHRAADYARHLAEEASAIASKLTHHAANVADSGANAAESARSTGRRWFGKASGAYDDAADTARHYADQAARVARNVAAHAENHTHHLRDFGNRLWGRARIIGRNLRHVHEEKDEGMHTAAVASTVIGCSVAGVGTMYFLDPNRGRARRAWAMDQCTSLVHSTGKTMRATGRGLANRFRKFAYGTRSLAGRYTRKAEQVDSEILIARIRSEIGHLSPNARLIQLMADADGTVTLTGKIARSEVDSLLTLIHRIPGVSHVVNQMDVNETSSTPQQSQPSAAAR